MKYAFIFGRVGITVRYWEERNEEIEGGCRVDVRRVEQRLGAKHRAGAAGFCVLPVSEGGIWRSDLLTLLSRPGREPRHHHHPRFEDGDVGRRVFVRDMTDDPKAWTMAKLHDLRALLEESGAEDLAASVDYTEYETALPAIEAAIDACLALPALTDAS